MQDNNVLKQYFNSLSNKDFTMWPLLDKAGSNYSSGQHIDKWAYPFHAKREPDRNYVTE